MADGKVQAYNKRPNQKATIGEASALARSVAHAATNHVVILARWCVLLSLAALALSGIALAIVVRSR